MHTALPHTCRYTKNKIADTWDRTRDLNPQTAQAIQTKLYIRPCWPHTHSPIRLPLRTVLESLLFWSGDPCNLDDNLWTPNYTHTNNTITQHLECLSIFSPYYLILVETFQYLAH